MKVFKRQQHASIEPSVFLVNYANAVYRKSQMLNSKTGIEVAGVKTAYSFRSEDIDKAFKKKHKKILDCHRGDGYWLWKPYFIHKILSQLNEGEYLFYCDSGAYFIDSIAPLVKLSQDKNQEIIPFQLGFVEKEWTKRDAFQLLDLDVPEITNSMQRLASFMLIRKSEFSLNFVAEWLHLAQNPAVLTDDENVCGLPNYEGFKEHRHDQSIFSLLTKKYGLQAFRDPSQWGNHVMEAFPEATYPQIIAHTRKRHITLWIRLKRKSKKWVRKIWNLIYRSQD